MNSILQRQVMLGALYSFLLMVILFFLYLLVFPLHDWTQLWNKTMFQLPIGILIPIIALFSGAVMGLINGIMIKNRINDIGDGLHSLQKGIPIQKDKKSLEEFQKIWSHIDSVQKMLIEQRKLTQKLTNERVVDIDDRIEEVVSEERNRLARELHDSVSQDLFAASMLVSAMNETYVNMDQVLQKQLQQVEKMIQQSQLEMRALLLHLRPVALRDKSLQEGMQQLLVELKQKVPLEIAWKIEEVALERGVEDHLFRILQESLSNTLRHAKAKSVDVFLLERENVVILRVLDDGVGFEVEDHMAGSYGLQNMKERAAEIGGECKIISVQNEGTRLEVRVPILRESEGDLDHD